MGALEAILALREESNRRDEAQANAISQGFTGFVDSFIKGRELQKSKNKDLIDELTLKVTAAKSGFDIDTMTGEIKRNKDFDSSMMKPVFAFDDSGNLTFVQNIPAKGVVKQLPLSTESIGERSKVQREAVVENPTLDIDTQRAVAASQFMEPRIQRIQSIISSNLNVFGGNKLGKLFNQYVSKKGNQLFVNENAPNGGLLETIVGDINAMKLTGFAIGGATYTGTERETIERQLDPFAKSSDQFFTDMRSLQEYHTEKARAGLIGLKEARETVSGNKKSEENSSAKNRLGDDLASSAKAILEARRKKK